MIVFNGFFWWVFCLMAGSIASKFYVVIRCSKPLRERKYIFILSGIIILLTSLLSFFFAMWCQRDKLSFLILATPFLSFMITFISKAGNKDRIIYIAFNVLNTVMFLLFLIYLSYIIVDTCFDNLDKKLMTAIVYFALLSLFILVLSLIGQKYYLKVAKNLQRIHVSSFLCIVPITFIALFYLNALVPKMFYLRENYNLAGMITIMGSAFVTYISLFFICIHMNDYYELYKIHKNEENKISLWKAQVSAQDEFIRSIKKYDHDRRHHDAIVLEFLESGDTIKAKEYLKEHLDSKNFSSTLVTYCNNSTVNCLLTYFANMAKKDNVKIDFQVYIPERLEVSDIELVGLYANLVENSIEACRKIDENERRIKLRTRYEEGVLRILLENSCDKSIKASSQNKDVLKSSKEVGGLGLQNVLDVVKKYNGMYDFDCSEGKYQTRIIMYVNQFAEERKTIYEN